MCELIAILLDVWKKFIKNFDSNGKVSVSPHTWLYMQFSDQRNQLQIEFIFSGASQRARILNPPMWLAYKLSIRPVYCDMDHGLKFFHVIHDKVLKRKQAENINKLLSVSLYRGKTVPLVTLLWVELICRGYPSECQGAYFGHSLIILILSTELIM